MLDLPWIHFRPVDQTSARPLLETVRLDTPLTAMRSVLDTKDTISAPDIYMRVSLASCEKLMSDGGILDLFPDADPEVLAFECLAFATGLLDAHLHAADHDITYLRLDFLDAAITLQQSIGARKGWDTGHLFVSLTEEYRIPHTGFLLRFAGRLAGIGSGITVPQMAYSRRKGGVLAVAEAHAAGRACDLIEGMPDLASVLVSVVRKSERTA